MWISTMIIIIWNHTHSHKWTDENWHTIDITHGN